MTTRCVHFLEHYHYAINQDLLAKFAKSSVLKSAQKSGLVAAQRKSLFVMRWLGKPCLGDRSARSVRGCKGKPTCDVHVLQMLVYIGNSSTTLCDRVCSDAPRARPAIYFFEIFEPFKVRLKSERCKLFIG